MTDEKTRTLIERLRTQSTEIGDRSDIEDVMREAADALSVLTVPDGDARERLADLLEDLDGTDFMDVADGILATFPLPSRDIAGEIEAVADAQDDDYAEEVAYARGLRRAAEIVRNGR